MRNIGKLGFLIYFMVPFLEGIFNPKLSHAGLLRTKSETLFSKRQNESSRAEYPIYEFMESSYVSNDNRFQLNSNFSFFDEPKLGTSHFNLYILDFAYTVIPELISLRAGRSFNYRTSTRTTTTDSVGLDFFLLHGEITTGFDLGLERRVLKPDLNSASRFIGTHLDYRSSSMFPLFLGAKYTFRKAPSENLNQQHLIGFSFHKPFSGALSPELLGSSEFDSNSKRLTRGELGWDLYPSYRSGIKLRALTYETTLKYDFEQPLFSIFSLGRLYEGMVQADYQFNKLVSTSALLAYDDYLLQSNKRTQGYRFEFGTQWFTQIFKCDDSVYLFKSYGGILYGNRIALKADLTDRLGLKQVFDLAYYEKITSSKRFAVNLESRIDYWVWDRLNLAAGFEFNRNNSVLYDVRALAKLTYLLWTEI